VGLMIDILILYFLSFLIIWQFSGYQLLMAIIAIISKPKENNYGYHAFVSIIVPVYNEEKVIENRINNLLNLDYPKDKYEIIVIESGSIDNTSQIVNDVINNRKNGTKPGIKLLQEKRRKGKASAINFGKQYAKGDIILITDANSSYDEKVLKELIPHFENPKVGAVGGRYVITNPDKTLTSSESFYRDLEHIMRLGESVIESAYSLFGTISAFKSKLVEADTTMLAEDLDMAIQVKRKGYRLEYEPKAIAYENAAATHRDQTIQNKRIVIGQIKCFFKHWRYLLFPIDVYRMIIFPSHRTLAIFSPFIFFAIPILYLVIGDIKIIIMHIFSTLIVFAVVFGMLMILKSKIIKSRKTSSRFSLFSIPKIVYYVLFNEYIILLAWKDFILRKYSVLWEKAESTRK
jgi:cellulose synthase/poly-beta-1,6-N-acetylglucosamine synthase-like glycosyltransferase